jgi:hypothetical protein
MTLLAGSTTVSATGVATGTGLSKALYDARVSALSLPALPTYATGLKEMAKVCNADATAIINYFVANATITATPTLTVPAGIAVSTAGTAAAQTGTTTATGTATGTVSSVLT